MRTQAAFLFISTSVPRVRQEQDRARGETAESSPENDNSGKKGRTEAPMGRFWSGKPPNDDDDEDEMDYHCYYEQRTLIAVVYGCTRELGLRMIRHMAG